MIDVARARTKPGALHIEAPTVVDIDIRCESCGKYLAEKSGRPWTIVCHRCKAKNEKPIKFKKTFDE